jgi:hypothetical protein
LLREKKHFKIYGNFTINTHYIHSVVVQDFVSGRVCNVNQYHYGCDAVSSRNRQDLIHSLVPPHYAVLYHHTMYVYGQRRRSRTACTPCGIGLQRMYQASSRMQRNKKLCFELVNLWMLYHILN